MVFKTIGIVTILLLVTGLAIGCGGKDKPAEDMHATMESHDHDMHEEGGKMDMGGTMGAVQSAEALYTCPMHSEVISADAATPCPLCKMTLNKMTDEKVKELRTSHPKGCPMDPIVTKGDSEMNNCPVCKMKLNTI